MEVGILVDEFDTSSNNNKFMPLKTRNKSAKEEKEIDSKICTYIHTYMNTYIHTYVHEHSSSCCRVQRAVFVELGRSLNQRTHSSPRGRGGPQWSENSVLAKKFTIYQGSGYFYLKFCLEALFDM
jgi:lysozyme family protein